jgi:5-methylcytosine-specific restriction endonuclease McrA
VSWTKTAADRRRDAERYRDPQYVRNRKIVLARAAGRCEQCGRRDRLEVDHKVPLSVQVDHSLSGLWALCRQCHRTKTAREGRQAPRRPADPGFDNTRPNTRW